MVEVTAIFLQVKYCVEILTITSAVLVNFQ